jgi:O-antigen/teichoic acid export membrane protein
MGSAQGAKTPAYLTETLLSGSQTNSDKNDIAKNLSWFIALPIGTQVIRFIGSLIVARLLTPADFGLVGLATVFIYLGQSIADFGFSRALVRAPVAGVAHFRALFTVNIVFATPLFITLLIYSDDIEFFYGIDYLGNAIDCYACLLLINALSASALTKLRRELKFQVIAGIESIHAVSSTTISIILAFNGYSFWSMIFATLISTSTGAILYNHAAGGGVALTTRLSPLRSLLKFSLWDFAGAQIGVMGSQIDKLIIGKMLGAPSLGIYDKAVGLHQMPANQIAARVGAVSFATLARFNDSPRERARLYVNFLGITSLIMCPIFFGLATVAKNFVIVLLGEQWLPMIPVFQTLAFSFLLTSINSAISSANSAVGLARQETLLAAALTVLMLVSIAASAKYGVEAVALVVFCNRLVATIGTSLISRLWIATGLQIAVKAAAPAVLMSVAMAACIRLPDGLWSHMAPYQQLGLECAIGAALYGGMFLLLPIDAHRAPRERALRAIRSIC